MIEQARDREEEANQQRQAEVEAERGEGIVASVEEAVGSILRPLGEEPPSDEERLRQRRANDIEQRLPT
jgi:hypothetical protein